MRFGWVLLWSHWVIQIFLGAFWTVLGASRSGAPGSPLRRGLEQDEALHVEGRREHARLLRGAREAVQQHAGAVHLRAAAVSGGPATPGNTLCCAWSGQQNHSRRTEHPETHQMPLHTPQEALRLTTLNTPQTALAPRPRRAPWIRAAAPYPAAERRTSAMRSRRSSSTSSSGTKSRRATYSCARCPRSVPRATCSRAGLGATEKCARDYVKHLRIAYEHNNSH